MSGPTLSSASGRIWLDSVAPTASEEFAEQGNFWLTTSNNQFWMCTDGTPEALVWGKLVSGSQVQMIKTAIDATATGATTLFTTRAGSARFYPTYAHVKLATVSGFVAAAALSIGSNSATFDNISVITALTGLSTANDFFRTILNAIPSSIAASTDVKANVTTAAIATTYTVDVFLVGFYL